MCITLINQLFYSFSIDVFKYSPFNNEKLLQFIPEGKEDAACIMLENGNYINIWKEEIKTDKWILLWEPDIEEEELEKMEENLISDYLKSCINTNSKCINQITCVESWKKYLNII